jgi:hypothetical protein
MTSADALTMTNDDQRLADILALLSAIDERLPKRRVKAAAVPSIVESDVTPAEKPKRARKPSAKAAAAAAKAAEPQLQVDDDEPTPAPAKPARKPRVKKATAPADSE